MGPGAKVKRAEAGAAAVGDPWETFGNGANPAEKGS